MAKPLIFRKFLCARQILSWRARQNLVAALIVGIAILAFMPGGLAAQFDGPPAPVVVSKVVATKRPTSQSFVGTLNPIRTSVVGSAVDGRVIEMFVDDGNPVHMLSEMDEYGHQLGMPIVQLRTVSLDIQISAAEVELQVRQEAEQELKTSLPNDIDSAQAATEETKARMEFARADYERLKELSDKGGGIPRRELDEAFSTFSAQSQSNIVAQALLKKLKSTKDIRLAQALSRVNAQEAEIRRLKEMKEKYTIRAPFDGFVTSTMTELGQWISRGDPVMEIVQLDPIELKINVPQNYVAQLQTSLNDSRNKNQKYVAQVSVDSVADLIEGEVVSVIPQADLRSRSFPVLIRIKNTQSGSGYLLKSGMLARASLFIGRSEQILLVKKDALVLGGPQISLYVVADNLQTKSKSVRPVPVQIGASIGDWIQVTGGIKEGDVVVVEGNERLMPGQQVQVIKELSDSLPAE